MWQLSSSSTNGSSAATPPTGSASSTCYRCSPNRSLQAGTRPISPGYNVHFGQPFIDCRTDCHTGCCTDYCTGRPGLPTSVQLSSPGLPTSVQLSSPGLPTSVQFSSPGLPTSVQLSSPGRADAPPSADLPVWLSALSDRADARPTFGTHRGRAWLRALSDLADAQPLGNLPAEVMMVSLWPSFQSGHHVHSRTSPMPDLPSEHAEAEPGYKHSRTSPMPNPWATSQPRL